MSQLKLPVYFDYMATTPVDPEVANIMCQYLSSADHFGNPASVTHQYGKAAARDVAQARNQVAALVNADAKEIIFTGSATEADNLAIIGAARFYYRNGKHLITMQTEHRAVLDACEYLSHQGYEITYLAPQKNGLLNLEDLKAAIRPDTVLISIMHVNNETGVIQDIQAIGEIAHQHGILYHVDAAQSVGKIALDLSQLPIDLMSLSAHKIYGPKGIGALFVRRKPRVRLEPIIYGGGHEFGLRSGTLATHQIVGMGEACRLASEKIAREPQRIAALRDRLWQGIQTIPGIQQNGDPAQRVCGCLNISFADVDGEALLAGLSNLAVSSGSACNAATIEPSHVLLAMGLSRALAQATLRISLGRFTTDAEVDYAIHYIQQQLTRLRS